MLSACRAGTPPDWDYSFGDETALLAGYAWFDGNSNGRSHPVGQKKLNPWGLYDIHGNLYEWCQDGYGDYDPQETVDPTGPKQAGWRVLRGGGWDGNAVGCWSALRHSGSPDYRASHLGFRPVLRSVVNQPDTEPEAPE